MENEEPYATDARFIETVIKRMKGSVPQVLHGVTTALEYAEKHISKAPHVLLEAAAHLPRGSVSVDLFGAYSAYHGDDRYRQQLEPLLEPVGYLSEFIVYVPFFSFQVQVMPITGNFSANTVRVPMLSRLGEPLGITVETPGV